MHTEKRRLGGVALRQKASKSYLQKIQREKQRKRTKSAAGRVESSENTQRASICDVAPSSCQQTKKMPLHPVTLRRSPSYTPACSKQACKNPHPLHHDAVYPHLSGASGVVKNIDPGESQGDHEEANILSTTTGVENSAEEEKHRLQEASKTDER